MHSDAEWLMFIYHKQLINANIINTLLLKPTVHA